MLPEMRVLNFRGIFFLLLFEKMADECWSMDDMNDKSCTLFPRLGTHNPCFYRGSIYGKCVCGVYEPFVLDRRKYEFGGTLTEKNRYRAFNK